jgi:hypothetical protein
MKRFIYSVLAAAAIFASCAKVDDLSERNFPKTNGEIVFNTNASAKGTKAIVEGSEMIDNFGVYGFVPEGEYSTGGYLMSNAEYTPAGVPADSTKHYYWPKSDNYSTVDVIFTAYAQFDSTVVYDSVTGDVTITIPALDTAFINDPSKFDDVLWAQTSANHQNANDTEQYRVPLHFKHTLSWLQFNAEVAENESVKWVKIDTVKFGAWADADTLITAGEMVADTTDTWMNLRRNSNVDGSPTRTSTDGGATYVDNFEIPAALVAEIKSYYSINNGTAGDYDLHMGNSVWPSAEIRQLRVVKDVPAAYRMPVETTGGDVIVFFNALKYLEDNGYKVTYRISGGKPAIFDYPIIDLFVNGSAYTIVGFNFGVSSVYDANVGGNVPALNFTIEQTQQVDTVYVPAKIKVDSLAIGGTLTLPTRTLVESPVVTNADKVPADFNFVSTQVDTLYAGEAAKLLSNVLVLPQDVPQYVTLIYTICVKNSTGDEVIIKGRRITRQINSGNDSDGAHAYPSKWLSSNKYIYNFKVTATGIEFNVDVNTWDVNSTSQYHVWDYAN